MMPEIIDSKLSVQQAFAQNPLFVCPEEILSSIGLMQVRYLGFDEKTHKGQIAISQSVMAEVEAFFKRAYELRFPIAKVIPAADEKYKWDDLKLMGDNVSSGFNYRFIAGSNNLSLHSRGLAFDINPIQNPYIRYSGKKALTQPFGAEWNPKNPGTLHADHQLVKLMEGYGWEWGGNWTVDSGRVDYQHFQKTT